MLFLFLTKAENYESHLSVWSVCEVTSEVVRERVGSSMGRAVSGLSPPTPAELPSGKERGRTECILTF